MEAQVAIGVAPARSVVMASGLTFRFVDAQIGHQEREERLAAREAFLFAATQGDSCFVSSEVGRVF